MSACPALPIPDLAAIANRLAIYPTTDQRGSWNPKAEGLRQLGLFDPLPHWLAVRRLWQDRWGNIRRIQASTKLCYAAMLRICGPDGCLVVSLPKLAAAIGMSARQIHRILTDLEEIGLIVRRGQRGHNQPNKYLFVAHEWMLGEPEKLAAPTPVAERSTPPRPPVSLQPDLPGLFPASLAPARDTDTDATYYPLATELLNCLSHLCPRALTYPPRGLAIVVNTYDTGVKNYGR